MTDNNDSDNDFESQADLKQPSLMREFWCFLAENKKWWLAPIVIVLLLLSLLLVLGGTAAAPFIYTLF